MSCLNEVSNMYELCKLLDDNKDDMFTFLRNERLIHTNVECRKCRRCMYLVNDATSKLKKAWRCGKRKCGKNKSATYGSFFYYSHIDIKDTLFVAFMWCVDGTEKIISELCGIPTSFVQQIFEYIHDVCSRQLIAVADKFVFGGEGHVVEIEDYHLSKRKYDIGKYIPGEDYWVLGIYDRSEKRGYMEVVEKRTSEVLCPIIEKHVRPGTEIHTDLWKFYDALPAPGFLHRTLKRSENVVDALTCE